MGPKGTQRKEILARSFVGENQSLELPRSMTGSLKTIHFDSTIMQMRRLEK